MSATPVCPGDSCSEYYDGLGTPYNVSCGLNLVGNNLLEVHADTFEGCLEYCDFLGACAGITYEQSGSSEDKGCTPYSRVTGYTTTGAPSGLYAAVPVKGASGLQNSVAEDYCGSGDNGTCQTDFFGNQYLIGCTQNIGGQNLQPAQADTLDGCMNYCGTYSGCNGVSFAGYPYSTTPNGGGANCYTYSVVDSGPSYDANFDFAQYESSGSTACPS